MTIKTHRDPKQQVRRQNLRKVLTRFVAALAVVPVLVLAVPASAAQARPSQVTVKSGDTLSGIAVTLCGSAAKYPNLAAGNHIRNADLIYPGQVVKATCAARPGSATASRSAPRRQTPKTAGWVRPVPGAVGSCYGWRTDPINGGSGWHQGLDFAAGYGTHVRAIASGVVKNVGWIGTGFGLEIMVYHGNGLWSHYAHLSYERVFVGKKVSAGDWIGNVGSTGRSTGDHLHLDIETDRSSYAYRQEVDPAPILRKHGISAGRC